MTMFLLKYMKKFCSFLFMKKVFNKNEDNSVDFIKKIKLDPYDSGAPFIFQEKLYLVH